MPAIRTRKADHRRGSIQLPDGRSIAGIRPGLRRQPRQSVQGLAPGLSAGLPGHGNRRGAPRPRRPRPPDRRAHRDGPAAGIRGRDDRQAVFEVEPRHSWRVGARQVLAYSAQCGLRPPSPCSGRSRVRRCSPSSPSSALWTCTALTPASSACGGGPGRRGSRSPVPNSARTCRSAPSSGPAGTAGVASPGSTEARSATTTIPRTVSVRCTAAPDYALARTRTRSGASTGRHGARSRHGDDA